MSPPSKKHEQMKELKAIKNKTSTLTPGKTYKVFDLDKSKNRVMVKGDNQRFPYWYSLDNFAAPIDSPPIQSVEGKIYIDAGYRRKYFGDWAYLTPGNQRLADRILQAIVQGNRQVVADIVGPENMEDVIHWINRFKQYGVSKPNATKQYVQSLWK